MGLKKIFYECGTHISHVQHILFISSESPFHTLITQVMTFQVYIIILYFLGLQRSIGQDFYTFQKIIKKKG